MSTIKTVIVSPEMVGPVRNGGIGTFVTYFARLLRQHNYDVTILLTDQAETADSRWRTVYKQYDIPIIHAHKEVQQHHAFGDWWFIQRSQSVYEQLPDDVDVVYFQDWQANGFHTARMRRYQTVRYPVLVNVLHSNTRWLREGMQTFPENSEETLSIEYAEQYTAEQSDFVAAPSQYMLDWVCENGWRLPTDHAVNRQRVLKLPFLPTLAPSEPHPDVPLDNQRRFDQLIFYGRLETRKGFDLFLDTLHYMKYQLNSAVLTQIRGIVFLGKDGKHQFGDAQQAKQWVEREIGLPVTLLTKYDTYEAQAYLADHTAQSLVIMPSLVDNFPYTVIEASLIQNLNFVGSQYGGVPEILGSNGEDQLCAPNPQALANKIAECFARGPKLSKDLAHYDWQNANQTWLDFHAEVCAYAGPRRAAQSALPIKVSVPNQPAVDVCIPFYNLGKYLPQLLSVLKQQTSQEFTVSIVNDMSTDPDSIAVFNAMSIKYPDWRFITNTHNQGLSQTRNIAAASGSAEYLLFIDADNVPSPWMIERYLTSIRASNDDCLTCYLSAFEGERMPYTLVNEQGQYPRMENVRHPLFAYLPLGNCPELGVFLNVFGDANFIIKRSVFEALNGFVIQNPQYKYVTGEDYEFLARVSLAGYALDVIPDYLFFYRYRADSLIRSTNNYANTRRVLAVFEEKLNEIGLARLIPLVYGLNLKALNQPDTFRYSNPRWLAEFVPWYILRDAFILKIKKHMLHLRNLPDLIKAKSPPKR